MNTQQLFSDNLNKMFNGTIITTDNDDKENYNPMTKDLKRKWKTDTCFVGIIKK